MDDLWIHVPTPGVHYSPQFGSALGTIVHEFSGVHRARGGRTRVIVGRGTRHDYEDDECVEVEFGGWPNSFHKRCDALTGRFGLPRWWGERRYAPVLNAVEREFGGTLFIHNNPVALRFLRQHRPNSQICLWANNEVWRPYGNSEARRVADATDRLICCSQFIADELKSRIGDHPNIRVVHSGVNVHTFRPAPKPSDKEAPIIAFIGRMVPQKGPHLLLRAASKLADRQFKVRFVGSRQFNPREPLTSYERELRELAAPLGERAEFVPSVNREQVVEEFQKTDIFCAPAVWNEPLGLTILEGMACGIPTVTTRRGGIPEVGGDAALYFEPEKEDELSELLAFLLENSTARLEAGKRARAHAECFAWENQYNVLCAALR